jgi:hypothetical protein
MYKQPLREKIDWFLDKAWNCWIKEQHLVKMDSHGHCYRCGIKIAMTQTPYTYVNGPKR